MPKKYSHVVNNQRVSRNFSENLVFGRHFETAETVEYRFVFRHNIPYSKVR